MSKIVIDVEDFKEWVKDHEKLSDTSHKAFVGSKELIRFLNKYVKKNELPPSEVCV